MTESEQEEQLKDCPFCNGEPELQWDIYSDSFVIFCGATISSRGYRCGTFQKTQRYQFNSEEEAKKAAIKKWNIRFIGKEKQSIAPSHANRESIFEEIQELALKDMKMAQEKISQAKEEIIIAFIAKYEMQPDEVCIIEHLPRSINNNDGTVTMEGKWDIVPCVNFTKKYHELLKFVKDISNASCLGNNFPKHINTEAKILLKEIGER